MRHLKDYFIHVRDDVLSAQKESSRLGPFLLTLVLQCRHTTFRRHNIRKSPQGLTVEVKLQTVGVNMVQRNVELSGHVLNNAAETARDEEHLDVPLVQALHKLPGWKGTVRVSTLTFLG